MRLYLGNLSYEVTEEDLREVLGPFGQVESVTIIIDKFTSRPKGFAFAEMASRTEALAAINGLNEKELKGRAMIVNEARAQTQNRRDQSSSGGGRSGYHRGDAGRGRPGRGR